MSKRATPDGEGADGFDCQSDDDSACNSQDGQDDAHELPTPIKRRRIEFEPIRLLAVSGVNDIDSKVERVQVYKLSERLRLKDRLLNEEKRKNETLHMRQDRDDTILCTLNRCWNRLDEEMRLMLNRDEASVRMKRDLDDGDEIDVARDFLTDLVEKDVEDADALCDKRVSSTLNLVKSIMDRYKRLSEQQKQFAKQLECSLATSSEEEKRLSLASLAEALDKASEFARLTSANLKLTKEADKHLQANREVALKVAKLQDEVELKTTKVDELMQALEDKDFELRKSWAREEKLDHRLHTMAKEKHEAVGVSKTNGVAKDVNGGSRELSELQAECDLQRELASQRLEEIKEMAARIGSLSSECELLRLQGKKVAVGVVEESEEYRNLKMVYDVLYEQYGSVVKELEISNNMRRIMENKHAEIIKEFEKEDQMTQHRLRQQIAQLESDLNKIKGDYEMLRIEFEQTLAAKNQQNPKQHDLKLLVKSLQTQNHTVKQEASKFKKKWKEAVNCMQQVQRQLEKELRFREQCILIRVDEESDSELASPDNRNIKDTDEGAEFESAPETSQEGELFFNRLRSRIDELKGRLEAIKDVDNEKRDICEILSRERRLRLENDRLIAAVKRVCSKDRKEKMKFYAEDCTRRIGQLEQQNIQLRQDAENAKAEEETLMNEMESTGNAFEELQEQNGKLLMQIKEKEEQNLKMMSDRIITCQIETKLKEEKATLVEKESSLNNMIAAQAQEILQLKTTQEQTMEMLSAKDEEFKTTSAALLAIQSKHIEFTLQATDLRTRVDKLNEQLKEAQEAVRAKTRAHESDSVQIRRMEEEKSVIKKRLERAKKYEQHGGDTELVLMEEIKDLKESLTCPSCKVNRKDAVLSKCFHVFCMKCLKTRYETRRRKCPKCNAAFGANEMHRLYLS